MYDFLHSAPYIAIYRSSYASGHEKHEEMISTRKRRSAIGDIGTNMVRRVFLSMHDAAVGSMKGWKGQSANEQNIRIHRMRASQLRFLAILGAENIANRDQ